MKKQLIFSLAIICSLILGSCATSNEVGGGRMLQKRKYNKGFYWNNNSGIKDSEAKNEEEFDIREGDEEKVAKNQSGSTTIYSEENKVKTEKVNSGLISDQTEDENPVVMRTETSSEGSGSEALPETTGSKNVTITQGKKDFVKGNSKKKQSIPPAADVSTILLVILAIIIPPLAVFLFEGVTKRFWIDLVLALLGWGVGFWLLGGLGWICGIIAIVYALMIVLNAI